MTRDSREIAVYASQLVQLPLLYLEISFEVIGGLCEEPEPERSEFLLFALLSNSCTFLHEWRRTKAIRVKRRSILFCLVRDLSNACESYFVEIARLYNFETKLNLLLSPFARLSLRSRTRQQVE